MIGKKIAFLDFGYESEHLSLAKKAGLIIVEYGEPADFVAVGCDKTIKDVDKKVYYKAKLLTHEQYYSQANSQKLENRQPVPYSHGEHAGAEAKRIREERINLGFEDSIIGEKAFCDEFRQFDTNRLRELETQKDNIPARQKLTVRELCGFAYARMDIKYILLGKRAETINEDEDHLLDMYRYCTNEAQEHIKAVVESFKDQHLNFLRNERGIGWEIKEKT